MLDKSGEFFLKPCVNIMHIVFDLRRVQLIGSLKVYSSHWRVLLGSWSVPGGLWSVLLGSGRFLFRYTRFLFTYNSEFLTSHSTIVSF